jgi:YggT family protein
MFPLHSALRPLVFVAFCAAVVLALGSWAVRTRRVSPFSALGRGLRSLTEPFLLPVERRLVRSGGNPAHAAWWLVIGVAVGGVVLLSLVDWLGRFGRTVEWAVHGGPRAIFVVMVNIVYEVLFVALVLRVLGSWFGLFRYSRWMRPAYVLTDWLVEPIRRVLPPLAMLDLSPLVAWLVLWVLRRLLLSIV